MKLAARRQRVIQAIPVELGDSELGRREAWPLITALQVRGLTLRKHAPQVIDRSLITAELFLE